MKLRPEAADAVLYPDVMVTCDPRDKLPTADTAKSFPILTVEVLSESTAAHDRGLKFEQYREIATLREYLLVEQDRRHADLFRRGEDGRWVLCEDKNADAVFLESVNVTLPLSLVYEDVKLNNTVAC